MFFTCIGKKKEKSLHSRKILQAEIPRRPTTLGQERAKNREQGSG